MLAFYMLVLTYALGLYQPEKQHWNGTDPVRVKMAHVEIMYD